MLRHGYRWSSVLYIKRCYFPVLVLSCFKFSNSVPKPIIEIYSYNRGRTAMQNATVI